MTNLQVIPLLDYEVHGNVKLPMIVFLHGFLGSKIDWLPLIECLKNDFYCICFDLPGHGNSDKITLPVAGLIDCAEIILENLESLGVVKFHLFGYSLGGRIALHLARLAPEKLLSLQLESCHPGLLSVLDKLARQQNDKEWADKLASLPIESFLEFWYQQAVFEDLDEFERKQLIEMRSHNNSKALLNCYQSTSLAFQENLWFVPNELSQHDINCQLYVGSNDKKFFKLGCDWQRKAQINLLLIDNAGHNIHIAAPKKMATEFIKSIIEPRPC